MSKRLLTVILLTMATALMAGGYVFSESNARPGTDRVEISWITASEDNVKQFVVFRGRETDSMVELGRINTRGPGSQYLFVDNEVMFKSTHITYYKVRAVDGNGNIIEESQTLSVIPNVSGVFRTWGAIKAMFR